MLNSRDIALLRPDVSEACKACIRISADAGIPIIITSTVRDEEYQAQLYRQGRDIPGQVVTMLKRPGFHWDVAALAFDFCPVDRNGKALWSRIDLFTAVGRIGKALGLEWGGDWKGFRDMPHLQWSQGGRYTTEMIWKKKFPPKLALKITVKFSDLSPENAEGLEKFVNEKGYTSKRASDSDGKICVCFPSVSTVGECLSIIEWGKALGIKTGILTTD